MRSEYPRMMYKEGSKIEFEGKRLDTMIVNSQLEQKDAELKGWCKSPSLQDVDELAEKIKSDFAEMDREMDVKLSDLERREAELAERESKLLKEKEELENSESELFEVATDIIEDVNEDEKEDEVEEVAEVQAEIVTEFTEDAEGEKLEEQNPMPKRGRKKGK